MLAAYALVVLLGQGTAAPAAATPSGATVLTLPRAPAAQEAVWLSVRVGVLPRGAKVLVLSDDGVLLGAISPFAVPPGPEAGTHTIPLPVEPCVRGASPCASWSRSEGCRGRPRGPRSKTCGWSTCP